MSTFILPEIWDYNTNSHIPTPDIVQEFLIELATLYKKHNLSLSHEDHHGAFVIEENTDNNAKWISNASINIR